MKTHRNFGIATLMLILITLITGYDKDARKYHGACALLTIFCFLSAVISGTGMTEKKDVA